MFTKLQTILQLTIFFLTIVTANSVSAQFTETFETLNLGQLDGQGGWHGWDGINTPFANVVNSQNHTGGGSQSAELAAGADSVTEFTQFTSGHWAIKTYVFAPQSFIGKTYFIVMNAYTDGGPYEWSAQVGFNGDTGRLECDCGSPTPALRPLVTGAWTDLIIDVDLDNDVTNVYYNTTAEPNPIATYPWSAGVFGNDNYFPLMIDAINLYPDAIGFPHVTPLYFDDISIEPATGLPGTPICFGDGSGVACGCGNESAPGSGAGCLNSLGVGARLDATGTDCDLTLTASGVRTQPGLFFQAVNTIGGGTGLTFGDGIRCCGQNVVRLSLEDPPTGPEPTATSTTLTTTTGITPGDKRCFQYWYRDSGGPCGTNFNLTNAMTVFFGPDVETCSTGTGCEITCKRMWCTSDGPGYISFKFTTSPPLPNKSFTAKILTPNQTFYYCTGMTDGTGVGCRNVWDIRDAPTTASLLVDVNNGEALCITGLPPCGTLLSCGESPTCSGCP